MTKLTHKAAGTFAIAPTPFHDDGRIDEKSIDRLTDFYTEVGCDGVTVLGIIHIPPHHWRWVFIIPAFICAIFAVVI